MGASQGRRGAILKRSTPRPSEVQYLEQEERRFRVLYKFRMNWYCKQLSGGYLYNLVIKMIAASSTYSIEADQCIPGCNSSYADRIFKELSEPQASGLQEVKELNSVFPFKLSPAFHSFSTGTSTLRQPLSYEKTSIVREVLRSNTSSEVMVPPCQ